jgi:hypothetical protein
MATVERDKAPSSLGVWLGIVGAIAIGVSVFLPLDEPGAFARVSNNTLIQHGGWSLLIIALGVALGVGRASQGRKHANRALFFTIIGVVILIGIASDKSLRTLYPLNSEGQPNASAEGTVASLGAAVYVAGVGLALALAGSWMARQPAVVPSRQESNADALATKVCPDCAESVLADARVCKHCGFRFDSADTGVGTV